MPYVLAAQAQECGGAFNLIKVSESKGKSISNVTIEIIAQLPREEYKDKPYLFGKTIRVSATEAETIANKKMPMDYTEDISCKNPLKQTINKTIVKAFDHQESPSTRNFGFCTGETYLAPLLLKISAPGYLTDYYIGNYLGGCGVTYEFVLIKKKKL